MVNSIISRFDYDDDHDHDDHDNHDKVTSGNNDDDNDDDHDDNDDDNLDDNDVHNDDALEFVSTGIILKWHTVTSRVYDF